MRLSIDTLNLTGRVVVAAGIVGYFAEQLFFSVFDSDALGILAASGGISAGVLVGMIMYTDHQTRKVMEKRLSLMRSRVTEAESRVLDLAHVFNRFSTGPLDDKK